MEEIIRIKIEKILKGLEEASRLLKEISEGVEQPEGLPF